MNLNALRRKGGRGLLPGSILILVFLVTSEAWHSAARQQKFSEGLTAPEFTRLVRELSEEGGYFRSDNFTSNETSYLHVIEKLQKLGGSGGAYIGVGPEQNFTYIAKLKPKIAFIVDIRRQAIIQHLMYKAIFHLSPNRTQFLSRLLSKPLPNIKDNTEASVNNLLDYFSKVAGDEKVYDANLAALKKVIQDDFQFPINESDQTSLDYVYKNFRNEGLEIAFRIDGSWGGYFPTLRDLIQQTDQHGKPGNFLAGAEDYDFVRGMHMKNLIIPIVGDFGGKKALAGIGDYLRKSGFSVTAFYTSNVEQFLFDNGSFKAFADNVRRLPTNERSLFIRAVSGRYSHPAQLSGHRLTTLLQQMSVFLKDFDEGRYQNYYNLITTNYIAAEK
ncbi:MAG: hypothetical protein L0220_00140 [Acidobacteria bacterium]|nr:hypothetical protein [Acidobacteriota bacterium]